MADLDKAIAAAREASDDRKAAYDNLLEVCGSAYSTEDQKQRAKRDLEDADDRCFYTQRDLLAALDAQPIAGEVWQYRANSTSRGKEWIDCRDEQIARNMEGLGFEIRCLYAAPPAVAVPPLMDFLLWADGWRETDEHDELTGADAVAYRVAVTIHREMLAAATPAPPAAAVPPGYALVPVEPTEAMVQAAFDSIEAYSLEGKIRRYYRAMLAAAKGVK